MSFNPYLWKLSATAEEVIELISKTDLVDNSKWNKKYPFLKEKILKLLSQHPDAKWAFRWAVNTFKKEVSAGVYSELDFKEFYDRQKEIIITRQNTR